jgi:hypothetical protein
MRIMMNENKANHQQFLEGLVEDHKPRKLLFSPEKRTALWFVSYTILISIIMLIIDQFRPQFLQDFLGPIFTLEMILLTLGSILLAHFSFLSVIPGTLRKFHLTFALIFLISVVVVLVVTKIAPPEGIDYRGHRPYCLYEVFFLGMLPLIHGAYLLKKGLLDSAKKTIGTLAIASALIPATLMHMACTSEPIHALIFHIGPVFVLACSTFLFYQFKQKNKQG